MNKAIETCWEGYRFRSRVEARWAVFFKTQGIDFDYEREGFELPSGRYLPDFWLPWVNLWAEVKAAKFSELEIKKCIELHHATGHACILLDGQPDFKEYAITDMESKSDDPRFSIVTVSSELKWYGNEKRFGFEMRFDPNDPEQWGKLYADAVYASRAARFEFSENQTPERLDSIARRVIDMLHRGEAL